MPDASETAAKRSQARLRKLAPLLDERLDACAPALEILVAEAETGEARPELWEKLHAAADRDDRLIELGTAYEELAKSHRLTRVPAALQVVVLMHGADFLTGILGDLAGAAVFLERVVKVDPEHQEAFDRLEKTFASAGDEHRRAMMYASVLAGRRDPPVLLVGQALAIFDRLRGDKVLPLDLAQQLARACAPASSRVVLVLEAHARRGERFADAATLVELGLAENLLAEADVLPARRRLVELYMSGLKAPAAAMPHVEALLDADANDPAARKVAEKLLTVAEVAGRAAAAIQRARGRQIG